MKKLIYFCLSLATAFVMLSFGASAATAGKVVTAGGKLNLRSSPSLSSSVVSSAENGSWLTIEEKSGEWYKVAYKNGKTAYANSAYIKNYPATVEGEVKITSGVLNVRSKAGSNYPVIDTLKKGEKILAVKSNSEWAGIVYQGNKTGYVAKKYLQRLTSLEYPAVKLSVTSFKQFDQRWKDTPIGTQGGTMGTIGCLTTAIAMTESYYSAYTLTPAQMAKKLSYSASGSLYWPSDYVRKNAENGYLKQIYSLLKGGDPVIFGAKTSGGKQHWVVIYGYSGSGELSADKFLIHDPGSNNRSTLQSLLSAYPNPDRFVFKK